MKQIYQSEIAAVFVTGLFPRYQFLISPGAFHLTHLSLNSAKQSYMPVSHWLKLQCVPGALLDQSFSSLLLLLNVFFESI